MEHVIHQNYVMSDFRILRNFTLSIFLDREVGNRLTGGAFLYRYKMHIRELERGYRYNISSRWGIYPTINAKNGMVYHLHIIGLVSGKIYRKPWFLPKQIGGSCKSSLKLAQWTYCISHDFTIFYCRVYLTGHVFHWDNQQHADILELHSDYDPRL
jgi:hypothetical protein